MNSFFFLYCLKIEISLKKTNLLNAGSAQIISFSGDAVDSIELTPAASNKAGAVW